MLMGADPAFNVTKCRVKHGVNCTQTADMQRGGGTGTMHGRKHAYDVYK